jgi:phospholipase C
MGQPDLAQFEHPVVMMFENGSFDNLLGYLYEKGEVPQFDGVTPISRVIGSWPA